MTTNATMRRAGALLLGAAVLAGCQGPAGPLDLSTRRERLGGPLAAAGEPAPLMTDPAANATRREGLGAPLAPGSSGPVSTGGPSSAPARALSRTPGVFDDNRGSPL